mmetsp:Transcript_4863/g.5268  ORF Transcript_4863/g.5268 Transcript_4863/m.5268 type:complete len:312 (+) Transcript_4863:34-969(+)
MSQPVKKKREKSRRRRGESKAEGDHEDGQHTKGSDGHKQSKRSETSSGSKRSKGTRSGVRATPSRSVSGKNSRSTLRSKQHPRSSSEAPKPGRDQVGEKHERRAHRHNKRKSRVKWNHSQKVILQTCEPPKEPTDDELRQLALKRIHSLRMCKVALVREQLQLQKNNNPQSTGAGANALTQMEGSLSAGVKLSFEKTNEGINKQAVRMENVKQNRKLREAAWAKELGELKTKYATTSKAAYEASIQRRLMEKRLETAQREVWGARMALAHMVATQNELREKMVHLLFSEQVNLDRCYLYLQNDQDSMPSKG